MIFGCAEYLLLCGLLCSRGEQGLLSNCGVWTSHCSGFSSCGALALGGWSSSCSSWALEHRLINCDTQVGCSVACSGVKLSSPALLGGFFITELPGKPKPYFFFFFLIAQQHGSELWAWLSWVLCVPNEVFNLGYFLRWLSHLKSWLGGDPLPSSLKSLLSGFPSSWAAGLKASVSPCLSTRGFLWFSVTWVSLQASLQQVACRVRERRHNNTVRSMSKTEDRHLLPNLGSDISSARFSLLETSTMSIYTQRENVSQGH